MVKSANNAVLCNFKTFPPNQNPLAVKLPPSYQTTLAAQSCLLGGTKSLFGTLPFGCFLPLGVLFALFPPLVTLFLLSFAKEEAGVEPIQLQLQKLHHHCYCPVHCLTIQSIPSPSPSSPTPLPSNPFHCHRIRRLHRLLLVAIARCCCRHHCHLH